MTIKRVWLDDTEGTGLESVDVLAEMEDGSLWLARFVTIPYLQQQMQYGLEISASLPDTSPVRYTTLETVHVVVDQLDLDTVEDVIDNLLELDVFECVFVPISFSDTQIEARGQTARVAGSPAGNGTRKKKKELNP